MHNPVGLTIVDDDNIIGIKSFLDDDNEKCLVILDNTGDTKGPVAQMFGLKDIEFDKIGMAQKDGTSIIYVFFNKVPPEKRASLKAYGVDVIKKFISNSGFVLFFKPCHVYKEGSIKTIIDTLGKYPEIGGCYSDFEIVSNISLVLSTLCVDTS